MGWRRHSADDAPTAQIDPSPLGTREDAKETGLLAGLLGNVWQAVATKNMKDRHIATGDTPPNPVHAAGTVAGDAAGKRITDQPSR